MLLACPHKATSPEEAQLYHPPSHGKYPSPVQPGGSLLCFLQLIDVPPTLWAPKLDAVFQEGSSKFQTGANNHFHHYHLQKIMKGWPLLLLEYHRLVPSLLPHRFSQSFLSRLLLQQSVPTLSQVQKVHLCCL